MECMCWFSYEIPPMFSHRLSIMITSRVSVCSPNISCNHTSASLERTSFIGSYIYQSALPCRFDHYDQSIIFSMVASTVFSQTKWDLGIHRLPCQIYKAHSNEVLMKILAFKCRKFLEQMVKWC